MQVSSKLNFHSLQLSCTDRYSKELSLPDYIYTDDGMLDREATLSLLQREEYGFVELEGIEVSYATVFEKEDQIVGLCKHRTVEVTLKKGALCASFPFNLYLPYGVEAPISVVHLNFDPFIPNRYCPLEELMERGINVAHLCYKEVSSDDGDFTDGIAPLVCDRARPDGAGKIAIWSYAASLVADYLLANGYTTEERLFVAGHSRLGKTSLFTAARDTRFAGVLVNNSGSCGAAIAREKTGETLERICRRFPFWFCPTFPQYSDREEEMPFDQHYLMALVAPRRVCVVTAEKDTWADTDAQYLCAEAASVIWHKHGLTGLNQADGFLPMGQNDLKGTIGFSKRLGTHYLSRWDWKFFLDFLGV